MLPPSLRLSLPPWSEGSHKIALAVGCAGACVGFMVASSFSTRKPTRSDNSEVESMVSDISVVIPALNEEKTLPVTLKALRCQNPQPRDVVVVDGGSEDRTPACLAMS